jgi:hypothetical protein
MNGESLEHDSQQERRARYERYLLGTLDEHERTAVREAVIRDPDASAELREVELDLLDAAADGTIEPARKKLVEDRLAADARNHASALVALALAEHRAAKPRKPAWRWSVALPAAAGLLMATGLGLFLLRGGLPALGPGQGDRPGAGESADPSAGDPSSTAAMRSPDAALDTTPRTVPGSAAGTDVPQGPPSTIAGSATPSPGATSGRTAPGAASGAVSGTTSGAAPNATASLPDRARTVALFLPAGTLRGARPSVRVPPTAETIRIELELDPPAPRHVDVTLRAVREPAATDSSSALWSAARVPVRTEQGQHIAAIDVPTRSLPAGVVEVHVTAQPGASSQPRVITFLVRRD